MIVTFRRDGASYHFNKACDRLRFVNKFDQLRGLLLSIYENREQHYVIFF